MSKIYIDPERAAKAYRKYIDILTSDFKADFEALELACAKNRAIEEANHSAQWEAHNRKYYPRAWDVHVAARNIPHCVYPSKLINELIRRADEKACLAEMIEHPLEVTEFEAVTIRQIETGQAYERFPELFAQAKAYADQVIEVWVKPEPEPAQHPGCCY